MKDSSTVWMILLVLLLLLLNYSAADVLRKFAAENDPGVLNVHVVPHTHDDVGWRKTVDQYYHGWNNTIDDRGNVHDIISTVVEALTEQPARTFTYAEIKFFSMWWNQYQNTNPALLDTMRSLVASSQWSFVNGGWCMHDEAASHYLGMIDQTTLGHFFLQNNLGVIPKTGWQLDPFGHSYTQASLLTAAVGMKALFFGRIDYQDLALRRNASECEGLWNVQSPLNSSHVEKIFWGLTGSYGGNYGSPDGFCFDALCPEAETLVGANSTRLLERINDLLIKLSVQSNQTKGQHIMLTMGTDFTYKKASIDFSNIDVMIAATMNFQTWGMVDIPSIFGSRFRRVNMFYSNPDYYVEQKRQETKIQWPVKTDDFFPYSDCPHCFWTGYFTSRTAFKRFERVASSLLLAARQIVALYGRKKFSQTEKHESPLFPLEDALGVAQHHDAISGTGKQHVADDYSYRLSSGMDQAVQHVIAIVREATNATLLAYCPLLLNETKCESLENYSTSSKERLLVVVYNPLAHSRSAIVRLPVSFPPETLFCVNADSKRFTYATITSGADSAVSVLTFPLGKLPPLGAVVVTASTCGSHYPPMLQAIQRRRLKNESVVYGNGLVEATFDRSTGMLMGLASSGVTVEVNQTWGYYTSYDSELDGHDSSSQNSGAYIFRPTVPTLTALTPKMNGAQFINTPVGIEVHATFNEPWVKQITRVYSVENYVEIEYKVGPVPIDDGRGKEIVTRLTTGIQSNGVFYTDSNGRKFLKRTRDSRPSWNLQVFEPVAGNYYPVNAAIYIQDNSTSLAIVVDRSQGGSSCQDGSVELMVQRRTVADDARGVDEPLNETSGGMSPYPPYGMAERYGDGVIVSGKHRILVGEGNTGASLARSEMDAAFAEPIILVGRSQATEVQSFQNLSHFSTDVLPKNGMLLALYNVSPSPETYLLRIAHQFDKDESKSLSVSIDVDLSSFFPGREVLSIIETTLSGNQKLREVIGRGVTLPSGSILRQYSITIFPMEVRTFLIAL